MRLNSNSKFFIKNKCIILYYNLNILYSILLLYRTQNCTTYNPYDIHNDSVHLYWPAQPDDPSRIRVASVIEISVLCMCVLCGHITNFLILLRYDIRPPSPNCNVGGPELAAGVNLRRHDTLRRTVMNAECGPRSSTH